jgi:hypothetical protein
VTISMVRSHQWELCFFLCYYIVNGG